MVGGGPAGLTAAIALASGRHRDRAGVQGARRSDNRTTGAAGRARWRRSRRSASGRSAARQVRAADRDAADRRHPAPHPRAGGHCSRPPRSGSKPSATTSRTAHLIAALDQRAAALPHAAGASRPPPTRSSRATPASTIRLDGGTTLTARLVDRRRRPQVALPRGRRHRDRAARAIRRPRSRCNLAHTRPHNEHLDRIPHGDRAVHAGAAAGPALQPRLRGRAARGRAGSRARRRCAVGRSRAALALDPRQGARSRRTMACSRWRSRRRTAFGAHRIALVGEAAHVMPPIGAQGLESRACATPPPICELVVDARRDGGDVGCRRRARALRPHAPRAT